MAFTNKTTNYGLPQYVGTDRPKILTDVNDAYAEIDKQLKANADAAAAATAAAEVAQSAAENASTKADTSQTTADAVQEGLDSVKAIANNAVEVANVADHHADLVLEKMGEGDIDKVNTTGTVTGILGNNSIVGIGDGTVSGAINSLAGGTTAVINTDNIPYTGGIGGTETSTLTGALEATDSHINSITGELTTAKNDITTINGEIGTTDITDIGDGTIKGAIASLDTGGASGFPDLSTVSTGVISPSLSDGSHEISLNVTGYKYVIFIPCQSTTITNYAELVSANSDAYDQEGPCTIIPVSALKKMTSQSVSYGVAYIATTTTFATVGRCYPTYDSETNTLTLHVNGPSGLTGRRKVAIFLSN